MDQENKVSKIFIVSLSSNGRGGKISIKKIKKFVGQIVKYGWLS